MLDYNTFIETPSTPGLALYYANDDNISETFKNAAISMTNHLRQTSNSTSVKGAVIEPVVYVRVNWPWLVYPAALWTLAGVVIAVTISVSHRKDRLVWKSSALALLFHGFRGGDDQEMCVRDGKTMESLATSMRARVVEDENGKIALRAS